MAYILKQQTGMQAVRFSDEQTGGTSVSDDESLLEIPNDLNLTEDCAPQETILNAVFPGLRDQIGNAQYMREKAILIAKNDVVHELNEYIIQMLPLEEKTYYNLYTTCKAGGTSNDDDILYPTEFLNTLICSGMPKHELKLKVGVPIMLLRNLNQADGLRNGTRFRKLVHTSRDIIGSNGHNVVIPRIVMSNADARWPFRLKRRQLPIVVGFFMIINKSQGQYLKTVGLYMKHQVFTHG
ncbi:uncharacterized protein LOC116145417 [Pistacia vera]|uniref:uncharacterized protein LOC116145417 n=1 Tax=Pistacia vera TaxID=55513 RepID=UPI001262B788|nr:uncharacterized protein LOC116145417 [Pistacia vera]